MDTAKSTVYLPIYYFSYYSIILTTVYLKKNRLPTMWVSDSNVQRIRMSAMDVFSDIV